MFVQKPTNLKIAEKLKILSKRIDTVLIQVDYFKNVLLSTENNFHVLCSDPVYETAIKLLVKKYPNIDMKTSKSNLEILVAIHPKIISELYFHYFTLVDVLEIKDNLMDLFGQISALQVPLDINLNFDITSTYLDIITNYSMIMLILSNISQVKTVLILYNFAMLSKFDQDEPFYHRLCERLIEKHKDGAINQLHNELNPYSKTIINAVNSLTGIVKLKHLTTADWDKNNSFKLTHSMKNINLKLMNPALLLPYSKIEKWVIFGYLSIYPEILKFQNISQLWRSVLSFSYSIVLFRTELIHIHSFLLKYFEAQKGCSKLVNLIKESAKDLTSSSFALHRSRRNYLRIAMRHQLQSIIDFSGIIATNTMTLCDTLARATDELHWLTRHSECVPPKNYSKIKAEDFVDPLLPEFMYQIEEIRYIMQQFNIINNFYSTALLDIDQSELQDYLNKLTNHLSEDEMDIIVSIMDRISSIVTHPVVVNDSNTNLELANDCEIKSFYDIRLDWFRLQTYLSYNGSAFPWQDNSHFIQFMNTMIIIHTQLVDNLPKFLNKFSSMKFLCYHRPKMMEWFEANMKLTAQHRYAVIFSRISTHFIDNCQMGCSEDYNMTLRLSNDLAHRILSLICQELCKLLAGMVKTHFELNQKLQPNNAIDLYNYHFERRLKDNVDSVTHGKNANKLVAPALPGIESKRSDIVAITQLDKELLALNQLAAGLNTRPVCINNRLFYPNIYLKKELIRFLNEKFVSLANMKIKREKGEAIDGIRRPSEMLLIMKECLSLVTKTSEFASINVSQLFSEVFLNQSLNRDIMGHSTITELYSNWYVDYVLIQPHILHTPLLKCFVTISPQNQKEAANITINVEEYTDVEELRALVEVIGPYGMMELFEKTMQMIVKNVTALKRFVLRNRSNLIELNVINLDYTKIKKLLVNMEDVEEFCQQWRQMGILFAFKDMCREAIQSIATKSMPFLKATVEDLQHDFNTDSSDRMSSVSEHDAPIYAQFKNQLLVNQLCNGFGLKTQVDSTLFEAIESLKLQQQQLQTSGNIEQMEDATNELLIVATSYLLPRLVGSSFYHVEYESLEQSAHCTAYAIKELMYVFFFRYGEERMDYISRKFIALTSSNLLRLGMETNSTAQINKDESVLINNRDSIYIFFDFVIQTLENVSDDFYEECFPYALVRQAYHNVVKQSRQVITKAAHPTEASSKAAIEACKVNNK